MDENEYIKHFTELVELEREEQMRLHEDEMRRLGGREREEKGRAFLKMKGESQGLGLGGKHLVRFRKQNTGFTLPESEIEVGDLVLVSRAGTAPWDEDNPTGTVAEKTLYSLTVAFDDVPPGFVYRKDLRIDLFVNDITFQRMIGALKRFKRLPRLRRDKLLGDTPPDFTEIEGIEFFNPELNKSQREAVLRCLAAQDFFLIHGPPGTGKTITCVEVIIQLVNRGYRVLATADSNVAVDNLVERLDKLGVDVVRIGHPARVIPSLRRRSLDFLVQKDPDYIKAQELRRRAYELKERMKGVTMPGWRRGLSDEAIMQFAREGRKVRGIPAERLRSMGRWLTVKQRIDKLFNTARGLEESAIQGIISDAEVLCATNSTAGSEILKGEKFDFAIIDEATQSTEPSSLIPVLKAKRFIMAGDHKQLPPTILNEEAASGSLSTSLFERLLKLHGDRIRVMLEVQYRMNDLIAAFPSEEFYEGKLRAYEEVKRRNLMDILPLTKSKEGEIENEDLEPLLFIDTGGSDAFRERVRRGSTSRENIGEARLVKDIAERLLRLGIRPEDIAIISPYDDQVSLIKSMLRVEGLEIKTVDGFQGREKEVVIVSFVRSNRSGDIGFLRDLRRLNVSITRAKRKLVLIGDSTTLESDGCYKRLIESAKERGAYKSVV
jgi:predicted DNA helicase